MEKCNPQKNNEPFKIWKFDEAPSEYQFSCGGDEDWVILIPKDKFAAHLDFLADNFYNFHDNKLIDGSVVRVIYHA